MYIQIEKHSHLVLPRQPIYTDPLRIVLSKWNWAQSLPPGHFAQVSKSSVLLGPLSIDKDGNCVYIGYLPAQSKKESVTETNKTICMVPIARKTSFLSWVLSMGCV